MWTVSVLVIFQVDEADVSAYFFTGFILQVFSLSVGFGRTRGKVIKVKGWSHAFSVLCCRLLVCYSILSNLSGFFNLFFPSFLFARDNLWICLEELCGQIAGIYECFFFLHRLKTTCMCSICGIGDIVLWDVKHCDISQLYCDFTLVLTHSTLYLLVWYSVGISETPSRASWYQFIFHVSIVFICTAVQVALLISFNSFLFHFF